MFGFRSGYSVANGINLLNDLACKHNHSNMYMHNLDADQCFDSIWHCGCFINLWMFFQWLYGDSYLNGTSPLMLSSGMVIYTILYFSHSWYQARQYTVTYIA